MIAATPPPLNVLRVIARLNVGGPARHVVLLNRGLDARGHHTLLVHGAVGEDEASLEDLCVSERIATVRLADLGRRISPLSDVRAFVHLLRLIFRERPDVVHTHTAKAGTLGRLAAFLFNLTRRRSQRCVVVHTFHGHVLHGYFSPVVSRLVRDTERVLSAMTDRVVAISPAQQRDLTTRFRVASPGVTVVVPLGLDLESLLDLGSGAPTLRDELGFAADEVVIGFVGRLVPIKDVPTLVHAFARALVREPRLRLVIAGDGSERQALAALVESLGLASRVRFLGWRSDLDRLYATVDVCALSSRNEGTPVALIEAMAAGKPVVASRVGGVPDVVEPDVNGILFEAGEVDGCADALVRLAADRALRTQLGRSGRVTAGRYTVPRLVDDIEHLYRTSLTQKRGAPAFGTANEPAHARNEPR